MIPNQPDQTLRLFFNIDVKPHTFEYDKHGNNPQMYTVSPFTSIKLPHFLATKFADQLADIVVNKRGIRTNYQDEKKKLIEEILL